MTVSIRLRLLRESASLSQGQVARAAGKSQAWLSNIEIGYTDPQESEVKAIETAIIAVLRKQMEKCEQVLSQIPDAVTVPETATAAAGWRSRL